MNYRAKQKLQALQLIATLLVALLAIVMWYSHVRGCQDHGGVSVLSANPFKPFVCVYLGATRSTVG